MGTKGRFMFDLNELPDEYSDPVPQDNTEQVLDLEPPCPVDPVPSCPIDSGPTCPVNASSIITLPHAQHRDGAPLLPGQHPLSCFRPFVRPPPRGAADGSGPRVNSVTAASTELPDGSSASRTPCPPQPSSDKDNVPKLVRVVETENGSAAKASDAIMEDGELKNSEALDNGHHEMEQKDACQGVSESERATEMKASVSSTNDVQSSEEITQDAKEMRNIVMEVQENAVPRSAPIDCSTKDPPKGHQSTLDSSKLSSFGKRGRLDQKEAMLGKKRNRQTMFLDVREAAKQAQPLKTPTLKKSSSTQFPFRSHKETLKSSAVGQPTGDSRPKDFKSTSPSNDGARGVATDHKNSSVMPTDPLGSVHDGARQSGKKTDVAVEGPGSALHRNTSWKQEDKVKAPPLLTKTMGKPPGSVMGQGKMGADDKSSIFVRPLAKTNPNSFRKSSASGLTYNAQDTSIERLHREATCDKLWRTPGEQELQCVPGSFESVQEYVNVFEPLLFEECRAQLHSTWEELSDGVSKDPHVQVFVKMVEKRERGWFDLVLLPTDNHSRLGFKEGDVAVISTPKPGSAGRMRRSNGSGMGEATDTEFSSRTAGIIRRYVPVDTRDLHGAILHFYVGESGGTASEEAFRKKFQLKGVSWYLTVLGSLATTQREYVALHAFQHLHSQMVKAILKPKPELFPRYEEDPPAMPDCFTQSFVQHLHRNFNNPQLAAIKWAAMHTAAGSSNSNGAGKRQDLWPFTLVQGPPGTGKTHTVWGMLNVIHLVQYQRYYAALLKKLAPDSLKVNDTASDSNSGQGEGLGSIDDVLQKMDQNLARILPKLCPKPRMLVCAPSNAATDELLTRVLERGFIDGEMKVYRPDVARVGVDTQSKASQAVSVERRSDQLLAMARDDVLGWLQQLRSREAFLAQQVASLQKELSVTAAAARSQGSVGVDPDVLVARDQTRDSKLQQLAAVVEERDKVLVEMSRLFIVEGRFRGGFGYSVEDARSKLEASFANEAEIVFTTVSSSGRRLFNHLTHGFDMVVIDEAAQASEAAVLPPLSLGAARCVLIGDPQQLPATVISRAAHTLQYSRSLFERFQQAGCPSMLLSVQYRMHPQIRDFPSRYFYQGRLVDSDSVSSLPDEPYHCDPLLRPYIFYDISHGRESHKGNSVSYQNVTEALFAAQLFEYLQNFIKASGLNKVSVGVITPYKLQLKCLQQEFGSLLGSEVESKTVYINTVDAFQGQERDVIIMSCVRASSHGVGFVADIRRMNVALTRARRCLWVVGNAAALVQSEDWAALIEDAKERGCFVSMNSPAVKNLLASSRINNQGPSRVGLLRAPKPPGPNKGGILDGEVKSVQGTDNQQASGITKSLSERPMDTTRDGVNPLDGSIENRISSNYQYSGTIKPSIQSARAVKQGRGSRDS